MTVITSFVSKAEKRIKNLYVTIVGINIFGCTTFTNVSLSSLVMQTKLMTWQLSHMPYH